MVGYEEYYAMRQRLMSYEEQNQKLQGTIRHLQAVNESLQIDNKEWEKKCKEYKDAFDDVFLKNIGNAWERYSDEEKKKINSSLKKKVEFFNKEVNLIKIMIRTEMEKQRKEIEKKLKSVEKELKGYKDKEEMEKKDIPDVDKPTGNSNSSRNTGSTGSAGKKDINDEPKFDNEDDDPIERLKASAKKKDKEKEEVQERRTTDGSSRFSGIFGDKGTKNSFVGGGTKKESSSQNAKNTSNPSNASNKSSEKKSQNSDMRQAQKGQQKKNSQSSSSSSIEKEQTSTVNVSSKPKKFELDYKRKWQTLDEKKKKHILENVQEIVKNGLTDNEEKILEIIAETGKFFISDISKEAEARGISLAQGKIYNIKEHLISVGLATEGEEISQISGRPAKPIFLTPDGFWLYVFRTKKNPIRSQLDTMAKDQKSVNHGVHIHQLVELLSKAGYSCVQEDIKKTSLGEGTICDILASKNKKMFRIEYEEGNYPKEGYMEKFRRILDVDKFIIFVGADREAKEKIEHYFDEYVFTKYKGKKSFHEKGNTSIFVSLAQVKQNPDVIWKHWDNFLRNSN